MKEVLLAIVFVTSGGEYVIPDGWHPRVQPSMEVCYQRADFLTDQLTEYPETAPAGTAGWLIQCVEREVVDECDAE